MSANSELLDLYVERYNAGDLDGVMELYAEEATQIMPEGLFEGRSAIRERLARDLVACPDIAWTVLSFVEQGDSFADEWSFVATHTGPFQLPDGTEFPATGKRVELRGPGHGVGADARRQDRRRQPVLRQPGRHGPTRPRPAARDRLIERS
jgi:predicted ester cyclase